MIQVLVWVPGGSAHPNAIEDLVEVNNALRARGLVYDTDFIVVDRFESLESELFEEGNKQLVVIVSEVGKEELKVLDRTEEKFSRVKIAAYSRSIISAFPFHRIRRESEQSHDSLVAQISRFLQSTR